MQFYSDDRQDEFIANLFGFGKNGTFLDIGSCASVGSNNTYFFESLEWRGICIEKNPMFNDSYSQRTCRFVNADATEVDYKKLFKEEGIMDITYLSLDVDQDSTKVLEKLLATGHRFIAITIEHDGHVHGDLYRGPQRELLISHGYYLLCADVLNQSGRNIGREHGWEDWWVHPLFFTDDFINSVTCSRQFTDQIIKRVKEFNKFRQ